VSTSECRRRTDLRSASGSKRAKFTVRSALWPPSWLSRTTNSGANKILCRVNKMRPGGPNSPACITRHDNTRDPSRCLHHANFSHGRVERAWRSASMCARIWLSDSVHWLRVTGSKRDVCLRQRSAAPRISVKPPSPRKPKRCPFLLGSPFEAGGDQASAQQWFERAARHKGDSGT
jgi:hypothetical protein